MDINIDIHKLGRFIDVPQSLPALDIIIISHNNIMLIAKCLDSVIQQTTTQFHIIVVDDSTDFTPKYIESLGNKDITLVHSDKPFLDGNSCINEGLKYTKYDYCAMLTNSMTVEFCWEVHAIKLLERMPKIGVVGMKTLRPGNGCIESAGMFIKQGVPIDFGFGLPGHCLTNVYEAPMVPWCFVIMRKKAVVGNLVEGLYHPFKGYDDLDNCMVLRDKGWEVYYCGYGAGYHMACATRGSQTLEDLKKVDENKVMFNKRWAKQIAGKDLGG
jgi:glycosyltransferase involved in cell wall biosynthesis